MLQKVKLEAPVEVTDTPLFDATGRRWNIHEERQRIFGPLESKKNVLVPEDAATAPAMEALLKEAAAGQFGRWIEEIAKPSAQSLVEDASNIFDGCIDAGGQNFRRELIALLAAKGEAVCRALFEEYYEDIGRLWFDEKQEGFLLDISGPLPSGTRFKWSVKTAKAKYEMFCIEAAPQRRTICLFGKERRLAFPWMCFLVLFKNGTLYNDHFGNRGRDIPHGAQAFWTFYRDKPLASESDDLYFTNLPHHMCAWPYNACLASSGFSLKLNERWSDKLFTWFWNSEFVDGHLMGLYKDAKQRIPEIANASLWEELSEKSPEKMLSLPWRKCPNTLGEFVQEIFTYVTTAESTKKERQDERAKAKNKILQQLREKLEEELHFLGAHLTIPPKTEEAARASFAKRINTASQVLHRGILKCCSAIAAEGARRYAGTAPKRT